MVTVAVYTIILLILHFTQFFSLSSLCKTNWLLLFSSSFSSYTHKHKHKHIQTYPHKQINTEIHKHTHADKPTKRQIGAGVNRLWIGGLTESMLVGFDSCGVGGARLEFMGRRKWVKILVDRCLGVDESGF